MSDAVGAVQRAEPSATPADPLWIDAGLKAACIATSLAITVPGLALSSQIWERSEFYSHGYLIPVISAYLTYLQRQEIGLALREATPPLAGPVLLLAAALVQVLAVVGDVIFLAGIGVPTCLLATMYAIGGRRLVSATLVPIGFLLFMVPPPGFLESALLLRLKLLVTQISVSLLQAGGYPVAASGNQLFVPGNTLFVADACSGLTSIVTLIPLGAVVAYFLSHGIWRRALIVLCVIPLAIAANIVRVGATVFLVSSHGIEFAQGLLHESFGVSTYVVGTLAILGVARILK